MLHKKYSFIALGLLLILLGLIAPWIPGWLGAQYRETAVFLPLILTIFRPIIAVSGVVLVILAAVFFGVPGWAPDGRKPDRESAIIIAVILGFALAIAAGAVLWSLLTTPPAPLGT